MNCEFLQVLWYSHKAECPLSQEAMTLVETNARGSSIFMLYKFVNFLLPMYHAFFEIIKLKICLAILLHTGRLINTFIELYQMLSPLSQNNMV